MFVNNERKVVWLALEFLFCCRATIPEPQKFSSGRKRPGWWLNQSNTKEAGALGPFGYYRLLSELQSKFVHKLPDPSAGRPGAQERGNRMDPETISWPQKSVDVARQGASRHSALSNNTS